MRRHALFVGVNTYANGIQPLSCARNDAEELWSFFQHGARFDWVEKLVDEQASSADVVRRKVRQMVDGLKSGDLFLLYFSGHGVPYLGRQLLVLSEARYRDIRRRSAQDIPFGTVALDNLRDDTDGSFDSAFLLDMCRTPLQEGKKGFSDGFSTRDVSLEPSRPVRRKRGARTIVFSCDENQHSVEITQNGRGLFSLALSSLVTQRMEAGRRVLLDAGFVGAMENEMAHIARIHGIDPEEQRPQLEPHGDPIILVDPAWRPQMGIKGGGLAVCPICGRKNRAEDTFQCLECGRDNLCLRHQDAENFFCSECVAERGRTAAEKERCGPAGRKASRKRASRKAGREKTGPGEASRAAAASGIPPAREAEYAPASVPPAAPQGPERGTGSEKVSGPERRAESEMAPPPCARAGCASLAPKAYRISGRVEVEWDWPEEAAAVRLLWRKDQTPVSAEDPAARRATVRRKAAVLRGRHEIPGCGDETLYFAAYLIGRDGQMRGEGVVFASIGAADRWTISYSLKKLEGLWWPSRGPRLRIAIKGSGRGMTGLPGFVVLKRDGGLPLWAGDPDATLVRKIPPSDALREEVEIPLAPEDMGCHVMVCLDGDVSGVEERIDWQRPRESKI